jgi:XRE family aerobic/anaerobic benzoate catabolism transcriptional regulator
MHRNHDKGPLLTVMGARVRALRLERGLTVREFAERAKLSPRFINQLEGGLGNISIAGLNRVAAALDSSIFELVPPFDGDKSPLGRIWRLLSDLNRNDLSALEEWLEVRKGSRTRPGFIAFIGLRGAGKSTVGPMLARQLQMEFIEVDALIEEAAGLTLAEIFNMHGEQYYRRLEHDTISRLLTGTGECVVAPGGSVVNDVESWELIKRRCFTIWLHASPEALMKRMRRQGDLRPMQGRPSAMEELKALLSRREPLYAESRLHVDTTGKSPAAVVSRIVKALKE